MKSNAKVSGDALEIKDYVEDFKNKSARRRNELV